jgi:hypothetical protein
MISNLRPINAVFVAIVNIFLAQFYTYINEFKYITCNTQI